MHTSNDYQLFLKVGNVLWIPPGSFKLNNVQTPQSLKNFTTTLLSDVNTVVHAYGLNRS
jgi:hypothetical protein